MTRPWPPADLPGLYVDFGERAAGWEFRVPIGKGKDGRIIYAKPGVRLTFRVPDFEGGATATPQEEQGVAVAPPEGEKGEPALSLGVAMASSQGATAPSEGAPAPPFSSSPHPSSSPRARAEQLMRNLGATEEETKNILDKIEASGNIRNLPAWLKTLEAKGDLARLIAEERQGVERRRAAARQSIAMAGGHHAYADDGCGTGTCVCERPRRHGVHGGT